MTTTTEPTLHYAFDIARRLSPRDRAQLITFLVSELAEQVDTPQPAIFQTIDQPVEDPWKVMDRIGKQLSAKGPLPVNAVNELSASRR